MTRGNPVIAIAAVWAPIQREGGDDGGEPRLVIGPPLNPFFDGLQWLALQIDLLKPVQEDFLTDTLYVRLPKGRVQRGPSDMRGWIHQVWK
jgi:hypothetical protein